jgi:hypothetical protein
MNEYKFNYRRFLFWSSKKVIGHNLLKDIDRMDLYFKDGSLYSISKWSKYDMNLGIDWVLSVKKQMEKESGANISINQL